METRFQSDFDRTSSGHPSPRLSMSITSASYAPHYPNMLCLSIAHAPGLSNTDLLQALRRPAEGNVFGPGNNRFSLGYTFTDIFVTFEEDTKLPDQATTAASQIARYLGLIPWTREGHSPGQVDTGLPIRGTRPSHPNPNLLDQGSTPLFPIHQRRPQHAAPPEGRGRGQICRQQRIPSLARQSIPLARLTQEMDALRTLRRWRTQRPKLREKEHPQTH